MNFETTIQSIVRHRRFALIITALMILFALMRVVFINADAPQDLSISAAIYTDEGFKTYAARNFVLFGDWKWTPGDQYESWLNQSPLGNLSYRIMFEHFGVSFFSIRILSIIYSVATMILLFFFVRRYFDRGAATISLILFGLNFFNTMSGRMGFFEVHLNFYIMASLFCIAETSKRFRERSYWTSAIFFILTLACIVAQYLLKKNFFIILIAILPALILSLLKRRSSSPGLMNAALSGMIATMAILYLLFSNAAVFQETILKLSNIQLFGHPLAAFIPLRMFDTLPAVAGKGLYLEFIFLQPIAFAISMFYAIYVFYSFITKKSRGGADLYLASWLLFGFMLLTIMSYHPSRYYTLFIIPMSILLGRALMELRTDEAAGFFSGPKPLPYNLMVMLLYGAIAVYSGVVLLVQAVPFSVRSDLMRILYPAFLNNRIDQVLYIVLPVVIIEVLLIIAIVIFRKRIKGILLKPQAIGFLFLAMVLLQVFQYGKWFFFHEYTLYNTSVSLRNELPENSILIGSWSSGLAIENHIRPLIIQAENSYNYDIIWKLLRGDEIPVIRHADSTLSLAKESNMPLYFAVSRNVVFEQPIVRNFGSILDSNRCVRKFSIGYFDVEIYNVSHNEQSLRQD